MLISSETTPVDPVLVRLFHCLQLTLLIVVPGKRLLSQLGSDADNTAAGFEAFFRELCSALLRQTALQTEKLVWRVVDSVDTLGKCSIAVVYVGDTVQLISRIS